MKKKIPPKNIGKKNWIFGAVRAETNTPQPEIRIREKATMLSVNAWYGAAAHAGDGRPDQIIGGHQQAAVQRQNSY
jgi:hypothetical protein